jgi:hypothetical protein
MSAERIVATGVLQTSAYTEALRRVMAGDDGAALDVWRGAILLLWMDRFGVSMDAAGIHVAGSGRPTFEAA